jgi:phosphotransferase family enzyme
VVREPEPEVLLTGGNMNTVVRVGATVRRTAGPWTPTIHALLRHIRAAGFTLAPEPLGIDGRGREILTFLPGAAGAYPLRDAVWLTDATLDAVAAMLRAYHDATAGFAPPPGGVWQFPDHQPVEVVCHNDIAPYNLIFDRGALTGIIDWDLASPGPRVWDVAYSAYRFVPLSAPANEDIPFPGADEQARRLARLCAVYDHPAVRPRQVLDTAIARLHDLNAFMHREAAAGNAAQQAIIDRGRGDMYALDAAYLEESAVRLAATTRC